MQTYSPNVGPFLLMIHAIVLLLMLCAQATSLGYMLAGGYSILCSILYFVFQSRHHHTIDKIYILFGCISIIFAILLQISIRTGYFPDLDGWNMMMTMGILIICYILVQLYLHGINTITPDIFHIDRPIRDFFLLGGVVVFLSIFYILDILSFLPCLWLASIMVILIKKRDYRMMVLGAFFCFFMMVGFSVFHHEVLATIAGTYCYFYLCAAIIVSCI